MNLTVLNSRSLFYSEKDVINSIKGVMVEWGKMFTTFPLTKDESMKLKKNIEQYHI